MRENRFFKAVDRLAGIPLILLIGAWRRLFGVFVTGRPPMGRGDKVLVIKLSALGDSLLILPLLKAIRHKLGPSGRLELVCTGVNRAALEGNPWADAVHVLSPSGFFSRPLAAWRWLRLLRRTGFDVCLDLDQWVRATALLSLASGARLRVGFHSAGQHRHHLYHASSRNRGGEHELDQFKRLARKAGVPGADVEPYAGFLRRERLFGAAAKPLPGRRVILHPGCGGRGWQREWPEDRFAALARRLGARGWEVLVTGWGRREEILAGRIADESGGAGRVRALDGSLASLTALLQGSRLLVCGNTGLMHLAAGLGVPVLALHGPTDPVKWGPQAPRGKATVLSAGLGCSPCLALGFEYGCDERPCMEAIGVDKVEREAWKLLAA